MSLLSSDRDSGSRETNHPLEMAGLVIASPSTATVFSHCPCSPFSSATNQRPASRYSLRTKVFRRATTAAAVVRLRTVAVHDTTNRPTKPAQPILPATRLWQVPSYRAPLLGPVLVRLSLLCSFHLPLYDVHTSKQISLMPAIFCLLCARPRSARPCALCLDCSPRRLKTTATFCGIDSGPLFAADH